MRISIIIALFACLCGLVTSCNDEEEPTYSVYVKTSYSEYQELMTANRCVLYTYDDYYRTNERIGLGGICLLRDMERNLHAFDLACPFERLRDVTLEVEMPRARCQQCGSVFDLTYGVGNCIEGPSSRSMMEYTKVSDRVNLGYIVVTN